MRSLCPRYSSSACRPGERMSMLDNLAFPKLSQLDNSGIAKADFVPQNLSFVSQSFDRNKFVLLKEKNSVTRYSCVHFTCFY
uniref:Uncharacterized protein n=1 Tax=mine drainage metagenome TaxID=410659 RepID=E6QPT6_9ZZZZ